uniref:Uncharacterized protein n=1 Tax=Anopheles quadriannulatus TaxID=34691 RepID=A0A182XRN6_ANOQN
MSQDFLQRNLEIVMLHCKIKQKRHSTRPMQFVACKGCVWVDSVSSSESVTLPSLPKCHQARLSIKISRTIK